MRTLLLPRYPAGGIITSNMAFRFTGTTGVTDAGAGKVSQWDDQSGNGRHLVQATDANRPITGTATLNGLNGLRFTAGTAQVLSTGALSSYGPIRTMYVVCRMRGQIPDTTTYYNMVDSNQVQYLDVGGAGASGAQGVIYAYDGTIRGVTGWCTDATMCYTTRLDGNNASSSSVRRNGVQLVAAFTGSTAANNAITTFRVGANSGSNCASMDVFEVIGYTVKHSDAEVAQMEAALNATWAYAPTTGLFAGYLQPSDYFDFSDTASITSSGGLASSIASKGYSGNAATAAGSARPTTGANTINGKNVLTFDGTANVLSVGTTAENRAATCIAVIKANNPFAANPTILGRTDQGGFLFRLGSDQKIYIDKSNISNLGSTSGTVTDATAMTIAGAYKWNTRWEARIAGVAYGGSTTTTMTNTASLQIGRDRTTSQWYKGDMGALAHWKGWLNDLELAFYDELIQNDGWGL